MTVARYARQLHATTLENACRSFVASNLDAVASCLRQRELSLLCQLLCPEVYSVQLGSSDDDDSDDAWMFDDEVSHAPASTVAVENDAAEPSTLVANFQRCQRVCHGLEHTFLPVASHLFAHLPVLLEWHRLFCQSDGVDGQGVAPRTSAALESGGDDPALRLACSGAPTCLGEQTATQVLADVRLVVKKVRGLRKKFLGACALSRAASAGRQLTNEERSKVESQGEVADLLRRCARALAAVGTAVLGARYIAECPDPDGGSVAEAMEESGTFKSVAVEVVQALCVVGEVATAGFEGWNHVSTGATLSLPTTFVAIKRVFGGTFRSA